MVTLRPRRSLFSANSFSISSTFFRGNSSYLQSRRPSLKNFSSKYVFENEWLMVRPIRPYTFSISDFCFHSLGHLFNKQHNNHPDGGKEYGLEYLGIAPRVSHILAGQNALVEGTYLLAIAV